MMKAILKKFQVIFLAFLVILGTTAAINDKFFKGDTAAQYVLSRRNPGHGIVKPLPRQKYQNTDSSVSLPSNTEESSNWSGYYVTPSTGNSYTSISGSWTVPEISSKQQNATAAQWIGLGGVASSNLLQMGTMEQIVNGQTTVQVFWEKLPDVAQSAASIPAGSNINVNIYKVSDSTWNLKFTVNTPAGQNIVKTISTDLDSSYANGIGTSAEWISEDPSNQYDNLVPLANMGTVKYQAAMANGLPLNYSINSIHPIAMAEGRNIMVYPSAIGADGESFTTTSNTTTYKQTSSGFQQVIIKYNKWPIEFYW